MAASSPISLCSLQRVLNLHNHPSGGGLYFGFFKKIMTVLYFKDAENVEASIESTLVPITFYAQS